jgi:membrane protein
MIKLLIKRNLKYSFGNISVITEISIILFIIYGRYVYYDIDYDRIKNAFIIFSIVAHMSTISNINIDYFSNNLSANNIFSVYPVTRRDYILSSYILTVIHTFIKLLFGIIFFAIINYSSINKMLTLKYSLFLLNIFIVMLISTTIGLFFTHTIAPKSTGVYTISALVSAFFITLYMEVYNSKLTIVSTIMLILTYYFCYTLSLNTYKNTDF